MASYAWVQMTDGTQYPFVLHVFPNAERRNEWLDDTPKKTPEDTWSHDMREKNEREALSANHAKRGIEYFSGIVLHNVENPPRWVKDATDGNSTMSPQPVDPQNPKVETWWTMG